MNFEIEEIKRLDHLGIVSGTCKSLNLAKQIDTILGCNDQEKITTGEAIEAMILNGLGFSNRVISLVPQFFETKPLDLLLKKDIETIDLNRFKLGRALDKIANYGPSKLFAIISSNVCAQEGVIPQTYHGDVTSITMYKKDYEDETRQILLTRGHTKRGDDPSLRQVVRDLMIEQKSGFALMMETWPGNTSDSEILKKRTIQLTQEYAKTDDIPNLIADSKLYSAENLENLRLINFITRVPSTIKKEREVISKALSKKKNWKKIGESKNKFQEFRVTYGKLEHRWVVVFSNEARERAIKSVAKRVKKEEERVQKALSELSNQRFSCKKDALKALKKITKGSQYTFLEKPSIKSFAKHQKRGRPTSKSIATTEYQITAKLNIDKKAENAAVDQGSCFVLASNVPTKKLGGADIVNQYKQQDKVEKSFAFIKDNKFFASSLFLKNEARIQALIMVMVLAMLIYSVAQRRMRRALSQAMLSIPNQINIPTEKPTLKWVFQLLEGINVAYIRIQGELHSQIHGMTDLRKLILTLFGPEVQSVYSI